MTELVLAPSPDPFAARLKRWVLPLLPFVLLIAIWALIVALKDPAIGVLPSPRLVLEAPFADASGYLENVRASLERLVLGFSVAAVSGIVVGIAAGLSRRIAEFLGPLTTFMSAISGIAWIPLAVAWFGVGTGMVVFIIWNAAFFLIFGNTMLGVALFPRSSETGYERLAHPGSM